MQLWVNYETRILKEVGYVPQVAPPVVRFNGETAGAP